MFTLPKEGDRGKVWLAVLLWILQREIRRVMESNHRPPLQCGLIGNYPHHPHIQRYPDHWKNSTAVHSPPLYRHPEEWYQYFILAMIMYKTVSYTRAGSLSCDIVTLSGLTVLNIRLTAIYRTQDCFFQWTNRTILPLLTSQFSLIRSCKLVSVWYYSDASMFP